MASGESVTLRDRQCYHERPAKLDQTMSLLSRAVSIYQETTKKEDYLWAKYVCRPPTALLYAVIEGTRVTPNQISFVSLLFGLAGAVTMALVAGAAGLWVSYALIQLAFIFDCMDGMVARHKGLNSPVGLKLDSLVDALKALVIVPAVGYRLYTETDEPLILFLALGGQVLVPSGILLTNFMRSPEFTGKKTHSRRAYRSGVVGMAMRFFSFVLHYPSWLLVPLVFGRLDVFLYVLLSAYALYCGYALLIILVRTARYSHYR